MLVFWNWNLFVWAMSQFICSTSDIHIIYVLVKLKDHNNYVGESVERSHYKVHSSVDVFTRVGAETKLAIDILWVNNILTKQLYHSCTPHFYQTITIELVKILRILCWQGNFFHQPPKYSEDNLLLSLNFWTVIFV